MSKKPEQGDKSWKKAKVVRRWNRRKAKQNPEVQPTYNRFSGWTH